MSETPARDGMLDFALAAFKDSPNPVVAAHANKLADAFEAEARAAVPSAPADRAALREQIAAAIAEQFTPDGKTTQGMRVSFQGPDGWPATRQPNPGEVAAAVLAVLPAPTDRAAILREAADYYQRLADAAFPGDKPDYYEALADVATGLRRMADEATAEHHTVDGVRHLCHTGDHYCPDADGPSRMADEAQRPEVPLRAELKPWQLLSDAPDEPLPQTERLVGGRRLTQDGAQQPEAERCGAWGGCTLARGHNIGQADIPENHRPSAVGAQQPETQALPQPEGPEYTPCACDHIEPEHEPNAGPCLVCDCAAYRPAAAPTDEDFLVAVEEALESVLLPEPGIAALERTRDAVTGALAPLVAELRRMAGEAQQPETQGRCSHCAEPFTGRGVTHFGAPDGPHYHVDREACRIAGGLPPSAAVSQPVVARQADTAGEQQ